MEQQSFADHPDVIECRRRIALADSGLNRLHVGSLQQNIEATKDDLLAAIDRLEKLQADVGHD